MKRYVLRLWLLVAPIVACDVPALPSRSATRLVNVCQKDDDCSPGGTCRDWQGPDGQTSPVCFAKNIAADSLLFEIVPNQLSPLGSVQARYLMQEIDRAQAQQSLSLALPAAATLRIFVTFTDATPSAQQCTWQTSLAQNLLGFRATFRPALQGNGIAATSFTSSATPVYGTPGDAVPVSWSLPMTVPTGKYDVYLQSIDNETCPVPPVLLRNVTVPSEDINLRFPPRRTLQGAIRLPPEVSFDGWTMEVVDSSTGSVLSTAGAIGPPDASRRSPFGARRGGTFFPLEYTGPIDASASSQRYDVYLRARPPADAVQPVLVWDEGAITLGNNDLDLTAFRVTPVTVAGKLLRDGTAAGVEGALWVKSQDVTGSPLGVPLLYQHVTSTAPDGTFAMTLLAGSYDVIAVPKGPFSELARTTTTWNVPPAPSLQTGRTISLRPRGKVALQITNPTGRQSLPSVRVQALALSSPRSTFDVALGAASLTPPQTEALTDPRGNLQLPVEGAGPFLLTVRPDPATGFSWSVIRGWTPPNTPTTVTIPWPFAVRGTVKTMAGPLGAPLPGGTIRVYARQGMGSLSTYTQVGETTIGDRGEAPGSFRLLLPSAW